MIPTKLATLDSAVLDSVTGGKLVRGTDAAQTMPLDPSRSRLRPQLTQAEAIEQARQFLARPATGTPTLNVRSDQNDVQ